MRYLFLLLTLFTVKAFSQSEDGAIKLVIKSFFEGMRQSDSGKMRAAFTPNAILQTIATNEEGTRFVRTEEVNKFISAVTKPHSEVYDERITYELIRVDADLGIAWTPYKFYIGEKFSHCGVNSFQLVRLTGRWKIQYIIDTRRKENCP